ncbi:rhodanese-like domain-containing protein [Bacteriovorax sp. Seq25_V]|uniref:rhodanese-like domain-containing protein n=1 Tax=Bacteriovorax sp. Seq25_V TaxID=1201288 RepID=UPI00038A2E4D|nr:rhodanese-like domain-containing protein [Bacteriovorax sp. Seq25_V]EQC47372.1 rhodanese-like protein [Bacteriovorax sp. Seq25_V]
MIKSMNVTELKERMDKKADYILIDCREQNEWDEGHIDGAIFIPLSEFNEKWSANLSDADKDKELILQCRSGRRSLSACQILLSEGFSNLNNLEGGILDWEAEGFAVIK